jgi:omega-6 fatty acid desaturase (delta-12 desaturase)
LQKNPYADGILDPDRPENLPLTPPSFTLKTIRDAIPEHCFKRNLLTSLGHLASDLSIIAALGTAAYFLLISPQSLLPWISVPPLIGLVLWPLYWFAQGSVMTGVWVLVSDSS